MITSTKFEVDNDHPLQTCCWVLIRYVTLWSWPFELRQWSRMADHVHNPSKFQDPRPIHSWVMNYDISMTMHLQPLCMRQITWLVRGGSKVITHLEFPFLLTYSLCRCRWHWLRRRLTPVYILDSYHWASLIRYMNFWPWTVVIHGKYVFNPIDNVVCVTWPVYEWGGSRNNYIITYLDFSTTICLFTVPLILGYDDDQGPFTL